MEAEELTEKCHGRPLLLGKEMEQEVKGQQRNGDCCEYRDCYGYCKRSCD